MNIKKIIAVASGKGGVGKSTVAVNLALALAKDGSTVGILDADIYGPSQPLMLGAVGERPGLGQGGLLPVERHGIRSMSIGYLIDQTAPMVWRGPMIGKALQQLLSDTLWGDLDYLVIDLPPGTGDVQLTLCQKVAVNGVVIVTTPQELALSDVRRACEMLVKMNVPIIGVVENMASHQCESCGHVQNVFGEGGGKRLAEEYSCMHLATLPLDPHAREMTDKGSPPVVSEPASQFAQTMIMAAAKISDWLSKQDATKGETA